ncbi:MAG: hypothetical protein ACT4ON_13295 [Bacteroidota bacterium]
MTALRKIQTAGFTPLRVVKNSNKKISVAEKYITTAWLFAQAALWVNRSFSKKEISQFKELIEEYFNEKGVSQKALTEFLEKVCLVKRYLARGKGRYVSKPIDWLNINYKNGITGTQRWYNEVQEQRKLVPEYNKGIRLLSKAVVKYMDIPTQEVYAVFRSKLIEERQFDLVQVLNSTVVGINYMN